MSCPPGCSEIAAVPEVGRSPARYSRRRPEWPGEENAPGDISGGGPLRSDALDRSTGQKSLSSINPADRCWGRGIESGARRRTGEAAATFLGQDRSRWCALGYCCPYCGSYCWREGVAVAPRQLYIVEIPVQPSRVDVAFAFRRLPTAWSTFSTPGPQQHRPEPLATSAGREIPILAH